jgi:signal transduction histidine kinase/ligand-binding sensor domain-containing protein
MLLFIIYISILGLPPHLTAQELSLYFNHYTNENGLSQNSARCIAQDSSGFIWIGTEEGLNRFDGYEFSHFYKNNNKFSSDYITDLFVDKTNRLWIGTWGGVNCYDLKEKKTYSFMQDNKEGSLTSNTITDIFIDSDNYIWIGTLDGLNKSLKPLDSLKNIADLAFYTFYNTKSNKYIVDNYIKLIKEDENNNIWVASSKGINRYDKKTGKFEKYIFPETADINTIAFNKKGKIWIGTNSDLYSFDIEKKKFETCKNNELFKGYKGTNRILSLLTDDNGGLYVGTNNIGIIYFKQGAQKYHHFQKKDNNIHSLQSKQINDLFIDKSNNLFVAGSQGLDIAKINNTPFGLNKCTPITGNKALSTNVRSVCCPDKQTLWLSFKGQGLAKYDRKTQKFKNYFFEKIHTKYPISIKTIYQIDKTNFLLGTTNNGLFHFNTQTGEIKQFKKNDKDSTSISSNRIFFITKDKNGIYWIGTQDSGLNRFDLAKSTFKRYLPNKKDNKSIGHLIVPHIFIDSKENMWVATFGGGLNLYNKKTDNFTRFVHNENNTESISSDYVTHIFEDADGVLWIGTDSGLNRFNQEQGSFIRYKNKDSLINEFIYAILEDNKSNLWLSTNNGLFCFNKKNKNFINYDIGYGLQNNEFDINSACKTPDSLLFFGGISGYNLFNPDSILNSSFEPTIGFIKFQLFYEEVQIGKTYNNEIVLNKSINNTDTIYLNYKNNQLSFEFTAFDYTKPSSIKYFVRLKGFNDSWHKVPATKRNVSYTNLNPGTYTLQIRASNANGFWSSKLKTLTIIIKTPFWQSWWFISLIILSFLLLIYFIFHLRTLYLVKQKKELETLVKERTKIIEQKNELLTNQKEALRLQAEELRSITDQLKDLNVGLEKQIASRTTDLNSALERAEDAQKLISSFLSNMSHELRTPMNAISGFTQLIMDVDLPSTKKQKYGKIINENIDTLITLVENVMNVAKLHTDQYELVSKTFYLPGLCNEIYNELNNNSSLKKKNVAFIFLPNNIPCINIHSDPKAFRHIIFNILENALKYTENGKVEFSCNCTGMENPNKIYEPKKDSTSPVLSIIVNDTGLGIKKEDQQNIFNVFHKVEHNQNKLFRGTGLGLDLVKNLTDRLYGQIKLESELNKGTKVSISIPLSRKD